MWFGVSVAGHLQGVVETVCRDRLMCSGLFQSCNTFHCYLCQCISMEGGLVFTISVYYLGDRWFRTAGQILHHLIKV